jgi:uncharacterized linocin/CFP29 family protein
MTANDTQVPWTEEQWARVNQVIQEEASRARVAATFLPLFGPLPGSTDFVRKETISYPLRVPPPPLQEIRIDDRTTIQLATLEVKVPVRSAQMADPDMRSVLAAFRRAGNVLARLEDAVVFRGLEANAQPPSQHSPPQAAVAGIPLIWEIRGAQRSDGLLAPPGSLLPIVVPAAPPVGIPAPEPLVNAVARAVFELEGAGHFGPFAAVLGHDYFIRIQTPAAGTVLPQDQIIPLLGGGSLLRSSIIPRQSGIVVGLGGAPVELVIATDVSLQFLQVTQEPKYLFRVREKMALRIKEADAISTLLPFGPTIFSMSPRSGPVAGASLANPFQVTIHGANLGGATAVSFGGSLAAALLTDPNGLFVTVPLPPSPAAALTVPVWVQVGLNASNPALFTFV